MTNRGGKPTTTSAANVSGLAGSPVIGAYERPDCLETAGSLVRSSVATASWNTLSIGKK